MEVTIRSESAEDFDLIDEVIESAFGQKNEAVLVRTLRETEDYVPELSLVAIVEEELVGHILFYPVKVGDDTGLILAPMAVKPPLQKKGIGGKLIREGFKKAVAQGYDSIILVGHPEYYPKFGFEKASKWSIKLQFEVPDEAFMAIELKEDSLQNRDGVVELPQPYLDCR
ncbi:GNAT family N-acetyltransferase [Candidatus Altiarchaeota archaeon]